MKSILMVKNLNDDDSVQRIHEVLSKTRVDYEVNKEKKCVIVLGNTDMVAIARKELNEIGFILL